MKNILVLWPKDYLSQLDVLDNIFKTEEELRENYEKEFLNNDLLKDIYQCLKKYENKEAKLDDLIDDLINKLMDLYDKEYTRSEERKEEYKKKYEEICRDDDDLKNLIDNLRELGKKCLNLEKSSVPEKIMEYKETYIKNKIKKNYFNFRVTKCSDPDDFKDKILLQPTEFDGIVVNCDGKFYDPISLVQKLRSQYRVKLPVVFTSTKSKENIISNNPLAVIISTPALQHKFVQLDFCISKLFETFNEMKKLSERQLDYVIAKFCDSVGMVRTIKHDAQGWDGQSQDIFNGYKGKLKYLIGILYDNDKEKIEEIEELKSKDELIKLCERYIKEITNDSYESNVIVEFEKFVCDREEQCIKPLVFDDNKNDPYTKRLIDMLCGINDVVEAENKKCRIEKPEVVTTISEFREKMSNCNVFFIDVEIWNNGELEALGFDVADELKKKLNYPFYVYLITHSTRCMHSGTSNRYYNPVTKGIYLKSEFFASKRLTYRFICDIKSDFDELLRLNKYACCRKLFGFYDIVKNDGNYPKEGVNVEYKIQKLPKKYYFNRTIRNYADFENSVKESTMILIEIFISICKEHPNFNFDSCLDICHKMRVKISDSGSISQGNDKFKLGDELTEDDIRKIFIKFTLRRFFLYIKRVISANRDICQKNGQKYKVEDIACTAITEQSKITTKGNDQSKGLTSVLLYTLKLQENEQLLEEEKEFVRKLDAVNPVDYMEFKMLS